MGPETLRERKLHMSTELQRGILDNIGLTLPFPYEVNERSETARTAMGITLRPRP